jgi:radical SAM superfamily enzyme YgiQ (UPF0313 family)
MAPAAGGAQADPRARDAGRGGPGNGSDTFGDGDVVLVSTYELGHQPIGLASPLGFLAQAAYPATGLDLSIEPLDAASEARLARARFVGISVPMHTALRLALTVLARVRASNPAVHVCVYGLYAPLNRALLLDSGASSVLGGEYESLLVDAVRACESGGAVLSPPAELRRLPFAAPARASLPALDRYAKLLHRGGAHVAGYVEASRGCLHTCRHCPIPAVYGGRFFVVPREVVLADVLRQVEAGATHVTIGDPDFLNGPTHAMNVARAIHEAHPGVTFDVTIKVEHILRHAALFPELRALGCLFVVSAVESLSDVVLAHLAKGHTREHAFAARRIVESAGIAFRPSFVPFTPWTTMDDYLDILEWIAREAMVDRVESVQLAIRLLVPPGSLLLELPEMKAHLGPLAASSLTYAWTHPDPRMDALQREVQAIAEEGGDRSDLETFRAICTHAFAAGGRPLPEIASPAACCAAAPRLSEAWFCCAEPTRAQTRALER